MPLADSKGAHRPLIAGADDPIHGRRFEDAGDDAFSPSDPYDIDQTSPDTLQSFDNSHKGDHQTFNSDFILPNSPVEGSFHEYSSDSAESSWKGEQHSPDMAMDGLFEPGNATDEPDGLHGISTPSGFFVDGLNGSPYDVGDTNMDHGQNYMDSTVSPSDLFSRPTLDLGISQHNRQNSQGSMASPINCSTTSPAVSPTSKHKNSQVSTPSLPFQTPSPPQMQGLQLSTHAPPISPQHVFSINRPNAPNWPGAQNMNLNGNIPHQHMQPLYFGQPQPQAQQHQQQQNHKRQKSKNQQNLNRFQHQQQTAPIPNLLAPPQRIGPGYNLGLAQKSFAQSMFSPCSLIGQQPKLYAKFLVNDFPVKSRVETQVKVMIVLQNPPPGIKHVHFPTHAISKIKLQSKEPHKPRPDTAEMSVALVCTSAMAKDDLREKALQRAVANPQRYLPPPNDEENSPQNGADVRICNNCMGRERKRAARKKIKLVDAEKAWSAEEEWRVLVINTDEVKDLKTDLGEYQDEFPNALTVLVPIRIACYCRHHGEKLGFNIIFTLKDFRGNLIGQTMSVPIMITDDHKTAPGERVDPSLIAPRTPNGAQPTPMFGIDQAISPPGAAQASRPPSQSHSPITPGRILSRPASPTLGGPAKKRKSSSTPHVPNDLTMTRREAPSGPGAAKTEPISPFQSAVAGFGSLDQMFLGHFSANPQAPVPPEHGIFGYNPHRSASMDNMGVGLNYPTAPSSHPSRAPSPSAVQGSLHNHSQAMQPMTNSFMPIPITATQQMPIPVIHKVIASEGPVEGGYEVSVLGTGFVQGLDVYFGNRKAVTTTFWGASCLVCLIPPASAPGRVQVICQGPQGQVSDNQRVYFTYIGKSDNNLMRFALECLVGDSLGSSFDVNELAKRVVETYRAQHGDQSSAESQGSGASRYNQASGESLDNLLVGYLEIYDKRDQTQRAPLDASEKSSKRTMLHFAAIHGLTNFAQHLIARGVSLDALDRGRFTSLHLAAIFDQRGIVTMLLTAGANPKIRNLSGQVPADVTQSQAILRSLNFYDTVHGLRTLSHSNLLEYSRGNSSVRSPGQWAQGRKQNMAQDLDSGEESPEYTDGDFEDSNDSEDDSNLNIRRLNHEQCETQDGRDSPTNALGGAFKEQFQQQLAYVQQSMAFIQNLAQIPGLSGMPVLPDYHAYLQQAPFMRQVRQYVPGMAGPRFEGGSDTNPNPEPEAAPEPETKTAHGWWGLGSYIGTASAPPPSYEEIFPQRDMDTKVASAAQAAVDAEADIKCATLYDQPSSSSSTVEAAPITVEQVPIVEGDEVPRVLQIGRKNAITKQQQQQFLRAREARSKKLSNDRKLFLIWIPLLMAMLCAILYSQFPFLFSILWAVAKSPIQSFHTAVERLMNDATNPAVTVS